MWRKIAANNVEFHSGHSQLAELLVAGQAAVCLTCYSHHYPSRIKKGAPVNYMLSEGVASINGDGCFQELAASEYGAFICALGSQPGGAKSDGARRAHASSP